MTTIKIPKRFYDDHCERDLPAPDVVRETNRHYWIDAESEHLAELLSDADSYSITIDWPKHLFGLVISAAATADAIRIHQSKAA
jgi:hypothetical protein